MDLSSRASLQRIILLGTLFCVCCRVLSQTADSTAGEAITEAGSLPFTDTTTVVQTTLPIVTFGNEWEDVTLTASVISADYNTSHVAPTSGLVMFMLNGARSRPPVCVSYFAT
jgi:hypothetical protein